MRVFFLVLALVSAVKRHEFKTCKDLGFCERNRAFARNPNVKIRYSVVQSSVKPEGGKLFFNLRSETEDEAFLTGVAYFLDNNVLGVRLEEINPIRQRYSSQSDLSINLESRKVLNNFQVFSDRAEWTREKFKYVLGFSPFSIKGFVSDELIYILNDRSFMNFERSRTRETVLPVKGEFLTDITGLPGDFKLWDEQWGNFRDENPNGPSSVGIDVTFVAENVYGIPEHADSLSLRDTQDTEPYRLYNLDVFEYELNERMALYGSVPFMISKKGGFFWNNPSETWVDIATNRLKTGTPTKQTHWFSETGIMEFYLFLAHKPIDLVRTFTLFTGPSLMPPMFAISYHQCRWNYYTQKELLEIENGFESHNLPVDVLWLDIEHTPHRQYFLWDYSSFPKPLDMINHLSSHGRKLVNIVDPHMSKRSEYYLNKLFEQKGLYVKTENSQVYEAHCWPGTSSWPDYLKKEARDLWSDQFLLTSYKDTTTDVFIWNDMNEPAVFGGPENTMPKTNLHMDSVEHREVHNLYGMMMHRATFEGLLKRSNNDRPFVLSRAFYAGSQRYGAIWTGDNMARWEHMEQSAAMCLAVSIGGVSFCGADLGGFFFNPTAELIERWYQLAAFSPFFRSHAHIETSKREPWVFGTETLDIARRALRQRYRLLPYIYTLFYENVVDGSPIMRALFMEFEDKAVEKIDKSYMLGKALMVNVLSSPGQRTLGVYLPSARWFDFNTYKEVKSGAFEVQLVREYSPVFLQGGQALFTQDRPRRSSALMKKDPYSILIALDYQGSASGKVFIDDHKTFAYKKGEFLIGRVVFSANKLEYFVDHQWNLENVVEKVVVLGLSTIPSHVESESGCGNERVGFYVDEQVVTVKLGKHKLAENWSLTFIYE